MKHVPLLNWANSILFACLVGCGDGPSTSSSSHWLACDSDSDCSNLPMTAHCGADGYCTQASGVKVEQKLSFEENFETFQIDPQSFVFETGFSIRNNDAEYYTNRAENALIRAGELILTARAEPFAEAHYTSASLETRGLRSWTYGRIAARILAPDGAGTGPAFWMLPENPGPLVKVCSNATTCVTATWPAWGDIVIMTVRSEQPQQVLHTASYAKWDAALGEYVRGEGGGTTQLDTSVAATYHEYAINWGPRRIDWLIDGTVRHSFDTSQAEVLHPSGVNPFQQAFHMKLSLAVGGLSEAPIAAEYPQEMRVDWVRVWQFE